MVEKNVKKYEKRKWEEWEKKNNEKKRKDEK